MGLGLMEFATCAVPAAALVGLVVAFIAARRDRARRLAAGDPEIEIEIRYKTRVALIAAIGGIFFFGMILGPIALYTEGKALRLIQEHDTGREQAAEAKAARAIGAIALGLWLLLCCGFLRRAG
jgi:hypothetical protein